MNRKDDLDRLPRHLVVRVNPNNVLMDVILRRGILSEDEVNSIKNEANRAKKSSKLYDSISSRNVDEFIAALREVGQSNIADFFAKDAEAKEANANLRKSIDRHYDFIVDRMSPDFGLIDKLYASFALTNEEKNDIEEQKTVQRRNKTILKFVVAKQKQKTLIEALEHSAQRHLAKYLEYDGTVRDPNVADGEWPLTEVEVLTIDSNYEALVDLLDTCELVGRLWSTGVINRRQREFISSKSTSYDKSKALLEILRRGSLHSYWQTIRCLRQSSQCHVAEILASGSVVVRVDANLEGEGVNTSETEQDLVAQINSLLSQRSSSEKIRILQQALQLNLIAAEQSHSVSLYFLCTLSNEIDRLEKFSKEGTLKEIIESLFNELSRTSKRIKITIKWTADVFNRCRQIIQVIRSQVIISQPHPTTMHKLPFEVLDIILVKSYSALFRCKHTPDNAKDVEIFQQLAVTDNDWFKRMVKRRFRKSLWQNLASIYRRMNRTVLNYRNNRQCIEECVSRLKPVRKCFKSSDFSSEDSEYASNGRNRSSAVNQRRLALRANFASVVFTFRNEADHEALIRYLRQTGQRSSAEAIENGGVAVKIEIKSPDSRGIEWSQQFVKRLDALKDKTTQRSLEIEKLIIVLKDDGIEILKSAEDKDAVLWICCKSGKALQKLTETNGFENIAQLFCQLTERNAQFRFGKNINIDHDQLEKATGLCPQTTVDFTASLDLQMKESDDEVRGVTQLRKNIYALCRMKSQKSSSYSVLNVFDNSNPFCHRKNIELKEISNPLDIASSEKENALYIIDKKDYRSHGDTHCVWMIKQDEQFSHCAVLWLQFIDDFCPASMSVSSSDGQVLMVSWRTSESEDRPPATLRSYDALAQVTLSVHLHRDIREPYHAVETATGNFVISHRMRRDKREKRSKRKMPIFDSLRRELVLTVIVLSRDGKTIIRKFNPEDEDKLSGDSLSPYGFVCYLCVDTDDRVFVTDAFNSRVILLDSSFRVKQILISINKEKSREKCDKTILQNPEKCYYDEENRKLIVVGEFSKRAYVYALKRV